MGYKKSLRFLQVKLNVFFFNFQKFMRIVAPSSSSGSESGSNNESHRCRTPSSGTAVSGKKKIF